MYARGCARHWDAKMNQAQFSSGNRFVKQVIALQCSKYNQRSSLAQRKKDPAPKVRFLKPALELDVFIHALMSKILTMLSLFQALGNRNTVVSERDENPYPHELTLLCRQ